VADLMSARGDKQNVPEPARRRGFARMISQPASQAAAAPRSRTTNQPLRGVITTKGAGFWSFLKSPWLTLNASACCFSRS